MDTMLLFFDIECANCFESKGKICTVGYVLTDSKFNIIAKQDLMLNPKSQWDWYVLKTKMLGYKKEEFSDKPTFLDEYSFIKSILTNPNHLVFGFSVENDFRFIYDECERYGLEKIEVTGYDIQDIYKQHSGNQDKSGLAGIAAELEIDIASLRPHISQDDSEISMLILKSICERMQLSVEDTIKLYKDSAVNSQDVEERRRRKMEKTRFYNELNEITDKYTDRADWKKVCFSDTVPLDASLLLTIKSMMGAKLNIINKASECDYFVRGKTAGKRDQSYEKNVAEGMLIKSISMDELIKML